MRRARLRMTKVTWVSCISLCRLLRHGSALQHTCLSEGVLAQLELWRDPVSAFLKIRLEPGNTSIGEGEVGEKSSSRRTRDPVEEFDDPEQNIDRSEEHTSELQSLRHLVCRLL